MSVARRTANICHSLNPLNLFLPPLHIKQGLMKSSLKAVGKAGTGFIYIITKFAKLTEAKIKTVVSIGPWIWQLVHDS